MKRKPLKRGAPLKRTTRLTAKKPLKSKSEPLARSPIKTRPKPRRSNVEQEASLVWRSVVVARGCEACPRRGEICTGSLQAHHLITRQQLRKRGLAHLDWDITNGFALCERAHAAHHSRRAPIERALLRPENLVFAALHDCMDLIERYYPQGD